MRVSVSPHPLFFIIDYNNSKAKGEAMDKVYLERYESLGYARYICTSCYHCISKMGVSYCSINMRGCCSYFPKFELIDIHRMVKSAEGLQVLKRIIDNPGTVVYNYYIHAKGYFDKDGYEEYLKNAPEEDDIRDKTIFFRACPFVKSGYGCTLPPVYRNYVCNFFICDEVINNVDDEEVKNQYIRERSRFVRWAEWENMSLESILAEHHLNLRDDFEGSIKLLQEIPLDIFEFPQLKELNVINIGEKDA
ncbi:conserved hypothetical protein [Thermoanaerobacterium thermosaccharolyticum DSM 571]|uniref:Uncharacterized protein n=2 Tax=Thermoanaerobacterium thermosaccharolyticum TaxID=1517 RepID=D9TPD8_THETC|nr:conserved hypothetical protein [Thermoanaerobacterium thermosaccharolyticum DSM 571]